ncbi:hypothetical protein [uncultured Muribaculum sp.]|uniref:hypothetical protein n=1 Tax=uncultured Muribaculum sp. TaxID=1918613 RepID=UPI0025F88EC3|nr:hypothetical protein [uncultured Muribaculum sp.]
MKKGLTYLLLAGVITGMPPQESRAADTRCEVAYTKDASRRSQQGMALWGDLLLAFEHGGHCTVYDRSSGSLRNAGEFDVESSSPANHCNQANFGIERLPGAEMPVIYLSVAQPKSALDMRCHVESVSRKDGKWSSSLVQTIELDTAGWAKSELNTIFGAPSWLIDRERVSLWVLSGRVRTVPAAMPTFAHNKLVATRFRLPAISEGKFVRLGADDVVEQAVFDMDAYATQSGCIHDGKIFYSFGFGDKYPATTSKIRVYDLDSRCVTARVDLDSLIRQECEALMVDGDRMLVNTNSALIYSVTLPEMPDPTLWRGTYRVDPFTEVEDRTAPEGYVPFMISTYCRHGIRHIDSAPVLPLVKEVLEWGDSTRLLTPLGSIILDRLHALWPSVKMRTGDLTAAGARQWEAYAAKLLREYPEVLAPGAIVRSQSTNVMRTARSMEAFNGAVGRLCPGVKVSGDVSSRYHIWLNPYANDCPTKLPIDEEMRSSSGRWYPLWRDFVSTHVDLPAWLARIFVRPDSAAARFDAVKLCEAMFTLSNAAPALDRPESFSELFTPVETEAMWEADNVRQYMQKGRHAVNLGRGWQQAARMLDNIVANADDDLAAGRRGARMRFGHDGCMMALLALLEADSWGQVTDNLDDVKDFWQTWRIPMASKVSFVFFRRPDNQRVLVKVLLNGKALSFPLTSTKKGQCYDWKEFRHMCLAKIDAATDALEASASTPLNGK